MPSKPDTSNWEISKHYKDEAVVTFKPGAHGYWVDDPNYVNPITGEKEPKVNARTGGGTSLTGTLAKGQGLMLWPMIEAKKYIHQLFDTTTVKELIDSEDLTMESILRRAHNAHTIKSDLGKSVGTDAHAWVEAWSREMMRIQDTDEEFVEPEIPEVQDIAKVLKAGYIRVINALKPKNVPDFKRLPRLLMQEIEMQEAIYNEATMIRNSILGAQAWLGNHKIYVHGAEDTVYSRRLFVCGKYDADWTVTCTSKCGWCCFNGNKKKLEEELKASSENYYELYQKNELESIDFEFSGRYIVDFKSTNASQEAPKGIYPEYLAQCAVYELAILEECAYNGEDRKYDGYLILNGSKKPYVDKKTKAEYPVFNTHFSFNGDSHREWAEILSKNKDHIWEANDEMKESNAGIQIPEATKAK